MSATMPPSSSVPAAPEVHSPRPAHLFVDISSHGFGHLAQVAPVLEALRKICPDLRLTVRSGHPEDRLQQRIAPPFDFVAGQSDFGYAMIDATRVDLADSAARYRAQHADWPQRVAEEAAWLARLAPDLVLTDVAYLPLAGAAHAGLPALSMSSLNWADLFAHYFGNAPWAQKIHGEILSAYRTAQRFLRLTPGMPMSDLGERLVPIPPVAQLGRDRRADLDGLLGRRGRRVLVTYGGFRKRLPVERWPQTADLTWLVPPESLEPAESTESKNSAGDRPDIVSIAKLGAHGVAFTDLLCSVDAIVTKPGYGTFAEAACNGTPVLYQRRDDWPEQESLIDWLRTQARCLEIDGAALESGALRGPLEALWALPAPPRTQATGAAEAAALIAQALAGRRRRPR